MVSFVIDRRMREDFSFWGYLFSLLAFWGGLSLMQSGSEFNTLLYCLINVGLMLASVLLERPVFIVFGGLGVFGYLGHVAHSVFKDSMLFPFALSALGIGVIALGLYDQRRRHAIERGLLDCIPATLREYLPRGRTPER